MIPTSVDESTAPATAESNVNDLETACPEAQACRGDVLRDMNSPHNAKSPTDFPLRLRINCDDDALRARLKDNAKQLLAAAIDGTDSDNNALLAKKALKHRKILQRMAKVDMNHPSFDVSKFLGVDWSNNESGGS